MSTMQTYNAAAGIPAQTAPKIPKDKQKIRNGKRMSARKHYSAS